MKTRPLQHPSTGRKVRQGLFAKLSGLVKGQIFVSPKNNRDVAELLSPSGRSGALASFRSWAKAQPREVKGLNPAPLVSQAQSWGENATSKKK